MDEPKTEVRNMVRFMTADINGNIEKTRQNVKKLQSSIDEYKGAVEKLNNSTNKNSLDHIKNENSAILLFNDSIKKMKTSIEDYYRIKEDGLKGSQAIKKQIQEQQILENNLLNYKKYAEFILDVDKKLNLEKDKLTDTEKKKLLENRRYYVEQTKKSYAEINSIRESDIPKLFNPISIQKL